LNYALSPTSLLLSGALYIPQQVYGVIKKVAPGTSPESATIFPSISGFGSEANSMKDH